MSGLEARTERVIDPRGGANQTRVRAYNERLVLSLIRRHGSLPNSEIARRSGLSAQTVSVIMRALENDGLILRGEPIRGKVGQPSIPMHLNPEGVYSIGLKVGRRSANLVLVDFLGRELNAIHKTHKFPKPDKLLAFASEGIDRLCENMSLEQKSRIAGVGISIPFELWNWAEKVGVAQEEMDGWRDFDFSFELEQLCGLPTFLQNDATSACGAELVFGRGSELSDFVYFFIGTFIGGGIVLNHAVYTGRTGNAAALGPMPVTNKDGVAAPLIDHASIYGLETKLLNADSDPSPIWLSPDDWSGLGEPLEEWICETAKYLALAIVSSCAIIDFEAAVIDGGFPADVRARLVEATKKEVVKLDLRGISEPQIFEGLVGNGARALGGASLPLFNRYLIDQSVLFKAVA
ncbi:MAG: ROK family transcriptional regulator [Nitratireductor sp.]